MLKSSFSNQYIEVGVDEVGRGCLAGSVVAAAVILPKDFHHPHLTDSKKLSEKQRIRIEEDIKKSAIGWAIAEASPSEIDTYNILNASILAMHRALDIIFAQSPQPELILVDGNKFKPYHFIPYQCIVKGDSKFLSIAAASVLAKNYRDLQMQNLSEKYPYYAWHKNVGYPTAVHKKAIIEYGLSPYHRRSFKPCMLVSTNE
ncbi:MAG: ribonuclease HII [Thermonemataceae bacterium]|nr:ribonuclease HII [Thermonemataceae bacterium]